MSNLTTLVQKEMLVCKLEGRVEVLIPKRRGAGFLKAPLGHHMNPLAELGHKFEFDFMGLDGALEIYGGCMSSLRAEEFEVVLSQVIPAISALNGFPFRVVGRDEFYEQYQSNAKTGIAE